MIQYQCCPLCKDERISMILSAEDYTVSHEQFEIWECGNCTLRFTQNVPAADKIGAYYQSENYISHSDTASGFINKLYHQVRKRTLVQKRNLVEKMTNKTTGSILDVGCGTGAFLNTMKLAGWQVAGLEPDPSAASKARELYGIDPLSAEKLYELSSGNYDAITLWHVLEHVHDLHGYMKKLKSLVKPGGRLFIAVPNYTSYDAGIYGKFWAAYDVPRHLYHFSPASMKKLFAVHDFTLQKMIPMWFDSIYVSMLSEQYKNGKPNPVAGIVNGAISNFMVINATEKCSSIIYVASTNKGQ